jgi:hypothetical protein
VDYASTVTLTQEFGGRMIYVAHEMTAVTYLLKLAEVGQLWQE